MLPKDRVKLDDNIEHISDLEFLFSTLDYWMSDALPEPLIKFCLSDSSREMHDLLVQYSDKLPQLKILYDVLYHPIIDKRFAVAASLGNLPMLQFVYSHAKGPRSQGGQIWEPIHCNLCSKVAVLGKLDCLQFLREIGCPWDMWTCTEAAAGGFLDCLMFAVEHGCPWGDNKACVMAARWGHLECLRYAHEQGCHWGRRLTAETAKGGSLACLQYVHEQGCHWDEYTCSEAAMAGNLQCLTYAYENGCPWGNENACLLAARNGHFECLRFAHSGGCRFDGTDLAAEAARCGSLKCLQYILEQGVTPTNEAMTNAAAAGSLKCMHFLHDHGCPWSVDTCNRAADAGSLECLQFAHQHGALWSETTCSSAASSGHLDCLEYAPRQRVQVVCIHLHRGGEGWAFEVPSVCARAPLSLERTGVCHCCDDGSASMPAVCPRTRLPLGYCHYGKGCGGRVY